MKFPYTHFLEEKLWEIANEWDETEDYSLALTFLNSKDSFRSFGDGLLSIIQKKYPSEKLSSDNVIPFLYKQCETTGVDISEIASHNTLVNWFKKGVRPKKGEASRQAMFALAFSLQLNLDETKNLFHRVYLDRAFNYRSYDELIYYFCLKNKKIWKDAQKLIHSIQPDAIHLTDITKNTIVIKKDVEQLIDEAELVYYINSHWYNFEKNSVTATETFKRLLHEAKRVAFEEINLPENRENFKGKWIHGNEISSNLLFEVITEINVTGNRGTKTVFNNVNLSKEIKNRFPEALTFSKKDMCSEERRKSIILLFSYITWYKSQWLDIEYDFDDYISQLDSLLFDCNYAGLYYGNPFDWLFLFCAQAERPLDMFRDIIQEVFEQVESTKVTD